MRSILLVPLIAILAGCAPAYDAQDWRQMVYNMQNRGLMREVRNPADAPYSNEALAKNFSVIMFHGEQHNSWTKRGSAGPERPMKRQTGPVTFAIKGAATPEDRAYIEGFMDRMRDLTGLTITEVGNTHRLQIHFVDNEHRVALGEKLKNWPRWKFASQHLIDGMKGIICGAYSQQLEGERHPTVIIVIRDEVEGILRKACIEEEIAQAFGPGADHPAARPSIFNDDQEFALLTEHDEYLFRILHDPRLKNGMKKAEAMPIVRGIIAELRPGK